MAPASAGTGLRRQAECDVGTTTIPLTTNTHNARGGGRETGTQRVEVGHGVLVHLGLESCYTGWGPARYQMQPDPTVEARIRLLNAAGLNDYPPVDPSKRVSPLLSA